MTSHLHVAWVTMLRPFESLNSLPRPALHPLPFHSLCHHNFPLLAASLPSVHIPFPHGAAPCFHFICQFLIQHNLLSSFLSLTCTHHRWVSFTLFHISVPSGLIFLFSFFPYTFDPHHPRFSSSISWQVQPFFLSRRKLFHSSFPNPFLPIDFQILLPFHYFMFPPPFPPSWAPYQHFFCTLTSTSTSSSPYHGAEAHQGCTGESLPFIFSSV